MESLDIMAALSCYKYIYEKYDSVTIVTISFDTIRFYNTIYPNRDLIINAYPGN